MHVSAPRPTYEKQDREARVMHDSTTPTLRINDMYSIEVEICLKRHVGARMRSEWNGEKWKRVIHDVSRQEFEVQTGRSELGRGGNGSTEVGIRCLKR